MRVTRLHRDGSDLSPYELLEPVEDGRPMGHEAMGVLAAQQRR